MNPIDTPTGIQLHEARAQACEAFALELHSAYCEQEAGGPRYYITRGDVQHANLVAKHARAVYHAALYDDLRRKWGAPDDAAAAKRMPIAPWQQTLLLDPRPVVPSEPHRDPHAVPDMPRLGQGWSSPLREFLWGRRHLALQLATDRERDGGIESMASDLNGPAPRVHAPTSFAERSQPPERDDDAPRPGLYHAAPTPEESETTDDTPEREPGDDADEPTPTDEEHDHAEPTDH